MIQISEYVLYNKTILSIDEYLLSKKNPNKVTNYDSIFLTLKDIFSDEDENFIRDLYKVVEKHMKENKFIQYRIVSDSYSVNDIIDKETKLLMHNLGKESGICEQLFENITEGMSGLKIETFSSDNDDYDLYKGDTFIMITNNDIDILIDTIPDGEDFDPEIKTYYVDNEDAVELSNRQIGYEFEYENDPDYIWDVFNNKSERYIKDFEDETGIELVIGGRNGKHICARGSYKLIHNLNKYIKLVEEYQNKLVKEIKDFIENNSEDDED